MTDAEGVLNALHTRFGFEVLQPTIGEKQIRALGRVHAQHEDNWKVGMQHILSIAEGAEWSADISRQYFLRGGVLVYAWRVIFQGGDMAALAPHILATLNNTPRARVELMEQPLPGVKGQRTMMNKRGKGAGSADSTPLLLQQRAGM